MSQDNCALSTAIRHQLLAIRAATVGAPTNLKSEIVEVGGVKIEVRQPTVGKREAIVAGAKKIVVKGDEGDEVRTDLTDFRLKAIRHCCFIPGTSVNVFEDGDIDTFRETPSNDWVDKLADTCMNLMNFNRESSNAQKN